jgi:predicted RNA binding protein YcfA (HicA-like mRNA interferase family)
MRESDSENVNLSDMKIRDAIKIIEDDGWFMVRMRGSHRQFKHEYKPGVVTIAGKSNENLARGTFRSILIQAGLKNGREKNA